MGLLLNICLSSCPQQGTAGPKLACGLCCLVALPGALDCAHGFTGVFRLGQDHLFFFILFLFTHVSEIALALNSNTTSAFRASGLPEMPTLGCRGCMHPGLGVPSQMQG